MASSWTCNMSFKRQEASSSVEKQVAKEAATQGHIPDHPYWPGCFLLRQINITGVSMTPCKNKLCPHTGRDWQVKLDFR